VVARLLKSSAELVDLGILLGCGVAGVTALVGVGDGGEVVVVVLGVLGDCGHCEVCRCRCCWRCMKRGDYRQAVKAKECLEVLPRVPGWMDMTTGRGGGEGCLVSGVAVILFVGAGLGCNCCPQTESKTAPLIRKPPNHK
jgi:hypothetical protein